MNRTFILGNCLVIKRMDINKITRKDDDFQISYNWLVDETAIIVGDDETNCYILKGDHVLAYAVCDGLQECLKYFKDNEDKIAFYSN